MVNDKFKKARMAQSLEANKSKFLARSNLMMCWRWNQPNTLRKIVG